VPGDFIKADEPIAKIETDKVTVEILAAHSGVIKKYFAAEGDTVTVGAQFLEIDTDAKAGAAPAKETPKEAPKVNLLFDRNNKL
jgi:2-oxoglutarate dehydrogenase E2 component (dihydrolipoamide succinyltransferase)